MAPWVLAMPLVGHALGAGDPIMSFPDGPVGLFPGPNVYTPRPEV